MAELLSSKVVILEEPPSIRSLPTIPTGLAAFVGLAKRGPVGVATLITSFEEYVRIFGTYDANADMTLAVDQFFKNGGRSCFCTRTMHYTDVTDPNTYIGVKATYDILDRGGVAAPAVVTSTAGPWRLAVGDHIDVNMEGGGSDVGTIAATAGYQNNAGTPQMYNMAGVPLTLTVQIDGGAVQTVTFTAGDFVAPATATAAEVAQAINNQIVGASAKTITAGTEVQITSDVLGTASTVLVTGGTATGILNFVAAIAGTGNVADVTSVTPTEIAAILTAIPLSSGTAVVSGSTVVLTSAGTGVAATIEIEATTSTTVPIYAVGTTTGSDAGTSNTLQVDGKTEGAYGDNISVEIKAPTSGDTDEFNLEVSESSVLKEVFPNLSMTDTDVNYVETIVNDADTGSNLISCTDLNSPAVSPNDLPAIGTYTLTGGDDGLTGLADTDYIGSAAGGTGLYSLDNVQDVSIGPLCPNRCTSAVQNAQLDYAETTRGGSMFVILGPPAGNSKTAIVTYVQTTAQLEGKTEFGAFYWPRTKVVNPSSTIYGIAADITVDPVGMIAGTYARTDNAIVGGIYRAPAGIEFGQLLGVVGLETDDVLNEAVRDYIVPHRINPITTFQGVPIFIDGHDTLKGDGNFPTVPERRGVIYIEQTIKRGLEVFRHAPNDERTRTEVYQTIFGFLASEMRKRAFRTTDPDTAFGVDTGEGINPPSEQFAGRLNVKVTLATNKPNKWIVVTFSQDVRAIEEELATS